MCSFLALDENSNYTGLVIVASLTVILAGSVIYIVRRESRKRRISKEFGK